MIRSRTVALAASVAAIPLALAGPAFASSGHAASTKTKTTTTTATFATGVLPPPPAGSTTTYNSAGEPQIRANADGTYFITSEDGLGAGTDAWRSTNGGSSYTALPQPNALSQASGATGLAPAGGDTDLATAAVKNASGTYNTYVASLNLANIAVSASSDAGQTWTTNPIGASVPGDDREWIAPVGASSFVLSYHAESGGAQIVINQGTLVNGVPTSEQTYTAINPAQTEIANASLSNNELGNIAVDPTTGNVYQIFVACPESLTAVVTCTNDSTAYMAVGFPTGNTTAGLPSYTFTDFKIADLPTSWALNNQFPNVAVDKAGNVYAAWSYEDTSTGAYGIQVSYSTDHGQTWSAPRKVNSGAATTALMPWMSADRAGGVDLAYYATSAPTNDQTCATTASTDPCQTEPWYVYLAQSTAATTGGAWTQYQVSPQPVHLGGVCQGGVSCTSSGNDNRDLYDDFGVAVSPTTGLASLAYDDDQYADNVGTANAGECTSASNNTASCVHTDFATQTAGTGV